MERKSTELSPCEGCPDESSGGKGISRRRVLRNGLISGIWLFLSRFLPPPAQPAAAQFPCGCCAFTENYCICGLCCESWAKDRLWVGVDMAPGPWPNVCVDLCQGGPCQTIVRCGCQS